MTPRGLQDLLEKFWPSAERRPRRGLQQPRENRQFAALASTCDTSGEPSVAFTDYIARMKEGQDKLYYLTGESYAHIKDSPYLEVFRKKGIEVLLMVDRIDEWLMNYLHEFDGKSFVDIARGDLDLGTLDSEEDKKAQEEIAKTKEGLASRIKASLGRCGRSTRLTSSYRFTGSARHRRRRSRPADAPVA